MSLKSKRSIILLIFSLSPLTFGYAQETPTDCLNVDALVDSLKGRPAHVQIDFVEIIKDHSLIDLAKRFPNTFLADRSLAFNDQAVEWSAIAKSYRSGTNVSAAFMEALKQPLSVGFRDQAPVFSADETAGILITRLLLWSSLQLPYGYMTDNTIYAKSLSQYQCKSFYQPGIGHAVGGGPKIVSSTPHSLTYINKDGGEAFTVSVDSTKRILELTRLSYFTVKHNCGESPRYEIHPVQVRYSIHWSAENHPLAAPLPPQTTLEFPGVIATPNEIVCNETETRARPQAKQKYFFQTSDLASHLDLPIANVSVRFNDRHANINSIMAVNYIKQTLNRRLGTDIQLTADYHLRSIEVSADDRGHNQLLTELAEKGSHLYLNAETIAQFCSEDGNIANLSAESLRQRPELGCIVRTEVKYDEYSSSISAKVNFTKWEPQLKIESLPLPFAVDYVSAILGAVLAKSPGNYGPSQNRNSPFTYQVEPKVR